MRRNKHSLSHYHLFTADMGKLIPVSCVDVLPGDSIQAASSFLVRLSPLVAPVMHPVTCRVHHWFVPYRILWDGWEDFITGGPDGMGGSAGAFPLISTQTGLGKGTVLDYMGVPPGAPNVEVSALPLRAYNMIFNEFYRDQDLVSERLPADNAVASIAWEKDYFTSARPWQQKGPEITMPIGTSAPVRGIGVAMQSFPDSNRTVFEASGSRVYPYSGQTANDITQTAQVVVEGTGPSGLPKVYADLTEASPANITDFRKAFALQRYAEARARYGSRYTEYLRYLGVRSSDARLQRPEYLGGGKQTISFSEVLKTGSIEDPSEPIGTMKGHGIGAMRSRRFRRFFEEHGVLLSLFSVRPRTMYLNALDRMWSKRIKEDYWQRELEQIGQQEVYRREVFAETDSAGAAGDKIFGYADRYAEYRHVQNRVSGDFRDTLDFWHLGRSFASAPELNQSFIECDPSKRVFAEQTQHSLWVMGSHSIQARRLVGNGQQSRIM